MYHLLKQSLKPFIMNKMFIRVIKETKVIIYQELSNREHSICYLFL